MARNRYALRRSITITVVALTPLTYILLGAPTSASAATCSGSLQRSASKRAHRFRITCSAPYASFVFMDQVNAVTAAGHTCVYHPRPTLDGDGTTIPFTRCTPAQPRTSSISGTLRTIANCGDRGSSAGKIVVGYGDYDTLDIATVTLKRPCTKPRRRRKRPARGRLPWLWNITIDARADTDYKAPWVTVGYRKSVASGGGSFDDRNDVRVANGTFVLRDIYDSGYENLAWSLALKVTGGTAYLDNQNQTSVRLTGVVTRSTQSACAKGTVSSLFLFDTKQRHGSKDYAEFSCGGADTAFDVTRIDIHRR